MLFINKELDFKNLSSVEILILKALDKTSGKIMDLYEIEDTLEISYGELRVHLNSLFLIGLIEDFNGYISITSRAYKEEI